MPPDQRLRLHHREEFAPIDQPRQRDKRDPRRIVSAAWLDLPLHTQCELLSQEQILGGELAVRTHKRRQQPQEITGESLKR
jgi:hypothetical protein